MLRAMNGDVPWQSPAAKWVTLALLALAVAMMVWLPFLRAGEPDIPYSRFKTLLQEDRVEQVQLQGDRINGVLREPAPIGPGGREENAFATRVPTFGDDQLLPALERHRVTVTVEEARENRGGLFLLLMLPWLLILVAYVWFMRRAYRTMAGGGVGPGSEMQRFLGAHATEAKVPATRFADVAGQENAKREISELVAYLRDPGRFTRLGAEIPRGVLLMGPPGTGKTLLARALAGEAGVPFFSISGSQFIEVFVGVGASRVRQLFKVAKERAPSIVFIDELDSIGRVRGAGLGGGHDEREQTLNQILAELDGFEPHEAVIVLAATNRPDVLDPALLRPGRFDRHVTLDLPDRGDRLRLLQVHSRKVPLADDVELERMAAGTPGFSGADIRNLVNEAAILAAQNHSSEVHMAHFDAARDRLLLGAERALVIQPEEKHRLAVHESGHVLVAYYRPHTDPLYKVTIIPRGHALGGTHQLPKEERHTLPEEYLRDRLAVMLGGRSAEKELIGTVSSGADDDIRQATALARSMVGRWGMSNEIGPVDLRESEEHPFLGREIAQPRRFSETSAQAVDKAVRTLLLQAEQQAVETIRGHRTAMERLVAELTARETLQREEIETILGSHPM